MIPQRLREIILVAVVGSILALFCILGMKDFTRGARELTLKTELRKIRSAIEFHFSRTGEYPPTLGDALAKGYGRKIELILPNRDRKGRACDPFGKKYYYNPKTGVVRSRSPGCEKY